MGATRTETGLRVVASPIKASFKHRRYNANHLACCASLALGAISCGEFGKNVPKQGGDVDKGMLWSFVGMALIGVTTIAYKNPAVYRRLTLGVIPILLCLLFASVGWNWGQSSAYQSLAPHLSPDRAKVLMTSFLNAIDEKSVYDAAMLIAIAYFFFLGYLPRIRSKQASSPAED